MVRCCVGGCIKLLLGGCHDRTEVITTDQTQAALLFLLPRQHTPSNEYECSAYKPSVRCTGRCGVGIRRWWWQVLVSGGGGRCLPRLGGWWEGLAAAAGHLRGKCTHKDRKSYATHIFDMYSTNDWCYISRPRCCSAIVSKQLRWVSRSGM